MLAAFKFPPPSSTIIPFSAVLKVWKADSLNLTVMVSSAGASTYDYESEEDRDQQYTNFETWLTAKTNSI